MTFDDYQALARRTQNPNLTSDQRRMHALHELASEIGEIHGLYQKTYQGHSFMITDLMKEIGDVQWGLSELCDVYGLSLDDIAALNIAKLRERYPEDEGFSAERSIHRAEYEHG